MKLTYQSTQLNKSCDVLSDSDVEDETKYEPMGSREF